MAFVLAAFVNYGPHALNVGPLRRLSAHTARKNFFNDILYHICKLPCKGHSGIKNAVTALAFTSVCLQMWFRYGQGVVCPDVPTTQATSHQNRQGRLIRAACKALDGVHII